MNIKPFKGVFPKVDLITSPGSFFANIKYQYIEYRNSGFYTPTDKEGFFIYRVNTKHSSHTGLLCTAPVSHIKKGLILKHEQTLAAKEQQMMHLLLQRKALVKPVLLGYNPVDDLSEYLKYLTKSRKEDIKVEFKGAKETHRIWKVYNEESVKKIQKSFKKIKRSYIGDGHHRTTTVALLNASDDLGKEAEKYSQLLTAFFPFNELIIGDFNRVVDITDIMPTSNFMAHLSEFFKIRPLKKKRKPKTKHEVTFLIDSKWYEMTWKNKYLVKKKKSDFILDADLINRLVFESTLGISDVRKDMRIKYYGGNESLEKLERQASKFHAGVGICIYPVTAEELTSIADKGETLPPKSTWFLPRLKSGIIAKDL